QVPAAADARHQALDDVPALRPPVDIVADRDNDAGAAARMRFDLAKPRAEQIVPAVNVANDVSETHAALSNSGCRDVKRSRYSNRPPPATDAGRLWASAIMVPIAQVRKNTNHRA